jgi:uncharacterized membrane protein YvbJ
MNREQNKNRVNQRTYQHGNSFEPSYKKPMNKKQLWSIAIAIVILGLILTFIFTEKPIFGQSFPIPGYP